MIDRKKLSRFDIESLGWSIRVADELGIVLFAKNLPLEEAAERAWQKTGHPFAALAWLHRAYLHAFGGTMLTKGYLARENPCRVVGECQKILRDWYDDATN
jgi:hypothetical protein